MNHPIENSMEKRVREIGEEIFARSRKASPFSLFQKRHWSSKMISLVMGHQELKNQLFRFIDVLPSLKSNQRIAEHIQEFFLNEKTGLSFLPLFIKSPLRFGLRSSRALRWMTGVAVKKSLEFLSQVFIAGEDSQDAWPLLKKMAQQGRHFTMDVLGEATLSEKEAKVYQRRYLELIQGLAEKNSHFLQKNKHLLSPSPHTNEVANVSIKLSSLFSQISNEGFDSSVEALLRALRPLARESIKKKVFLYIDMETYEMKEMILEVFERLVLEEDFRSSPLFGLVLQSYLRSIDEDLFRVLCLSKKRRVPVTVRLVKGAYWDQEVIHAKALHWPIPVWRKKSESDVSFERASQKLLENHPYILTALASHNIRSLAYGMAQAESLKIPKEEFEIQMLYGMGESFKVALSSMGFRVREYVPVGEVLPGMAYLVRRLLENTSNQSFLVAKWVQKKEEALLLHPPEKDPEENKIFVQNVKSKRVSSHSFSHRRK